MVSIKQSRTTKHSQAGSATPGRGTTPLKGVLTDRSRTNNTRTILSNVSYRRRDITSCMAQQPTSFSVLDESTANQQKFIM